MLLNVICLNLFIECDTRYHVRTISEALCDRTIVSYLNSSRFDLTELVHINVAVVLDTNICVSVKKRPILKTFMK